MNDLVRPKDVTTGIPTKTEAETEGQREKYLRSYTSSLDREARGDKPKDISSFGS